MMKSKHFQPMNVKNLHFQPVNVENSYFQPLSMTGQTNQSNGFDEDGSLKDGSSEKEAADVQWCDRCQNTTTTVKEATVYCAVCTKFLCSQCREIHEKCPGLKDHDLLSGDDLPKLEERYTKYRTCKTHTEYQNDLFCFIHKTLICLKCHENLHSECLVQTVAEISERIDKAEFNNLKESVNNLKSGIDSYRTQAIDNIVNIETQRNKMLKDAQNIHGSLIAKINNMYYEIKEEIIRLCKEQTLYLDSQKARIDEVLSNLDACRKVIEQILPTNLNEGTFLCIQDIVDQSRTLSSFLAQLHRSFKKIDYNLKPSQDTLELLDSKFCFGTVELIQQTNTEKSVPDIWFPSLAISPFHKIKSKKDRKQIALSSTLETIEEEKSENARNPSQEDTTRINLRYSVHIQSDSDTKGSLINAISVSEDGNKIFVDFNNQTLKLFGPTMKIVSSFPLTCPARGLCYIGNNEIVVSNKDKYLLFMDISENKLVVNRKLKMKHIIHAIASDKNLYLFRGTNPPSVKKIDKSGKSLWSVNKDKLRHKLFKSACDITCSILNGETRVIATDDHAETITMIDGDTGNILAVKRLPGKEPRSLTTDFHGNIYICFAKTHEICMMTRNLTEDKILLCSLIGLCPEPLAIAYDSRSDQIIVSNNLYFYRDTIDVFQKTFYI